MQVDREAFYAPAEVRKTVEKKIEDSVRESNQIDYLSFVPDGEPTLESDLKDQIEALKDLGYKIAVISNGSLIWQEEVRDALAEADWVSLKVDAVSEDVWKSVDRPHKSLELSRILDGALSFAEVFDGHLSTETMLIDGINDGEEGADKVSDFLEKLDPDSAYVAIPTRPPAEEWAKPTREKTINYWFQTFSKKLRDVEYLIGYEGNEFSFSGDIQQDLLSITSVHPMKREGVEELLDKAGSDWEVVEGLIEEEKLIKADYEEDEFFIRKLPNL